MHERSSLEGLFLRYPVIVALQRVTLNVENKDIVVDNIAFSITINKSQVKSLKVCETNHELLFFSHGQ